MNLTLEIQLIYSGFSIVSLFSSLLARLQVWSSFYYMFRLPPSFEISFLTFLRANKQSFHSFFLSTSNLLTYGESSSSSLFFPSTVNNPLLSLQFFLLLLIHSRRLMRCPERFKSLLLFSYLHWAVLSHLEKEIPLFGISSRRLIGPTSFPLIFYAIWMNKSINGSAGVLRPSRPVRSDSCVLHWFTSSVSFFA